MMIRLRRKSLQAICLATLGLVAGCATPPSSPGQKAPDIHPITRDEVGLIGDSLDELVDERVAGFKLLTGKEPIAWGRYICRPSGSNLSASEFDAFRRHSLRPILILQPGQEDMYGGEDKGQAAAQCFEDSLASLRAAGAADLLPNSGLSIFLDVEPGTPLSFSYLSGLTTKLQNDGILEGASTFGIYMNASDVSRLQTTINSVISNHAPINSVWIASYLGLSCGPISYWDENNSPPAGEINAATEMWQYAAECHAYGSPYENFGFDLSGKRPPIQKITQEGAQGAAMSDNALPPQQMRPSR